jgi:heavy metal sensor kinase
VTYESIGPDSPDYIKDVIRQGAKAKAVRVRMDARGIPYLIRSGVIFDPEHHKYFLAIGRAIDTNNRVLKEFTFRYFIIVPAVVLVSGLLGWFLAGRALAPVNSVAEAAQRITHSNLNMQIPSRGAGDELDRLIESFNRMMERLSCSFAQIRQFSTDVSHELRTPLTIVRGQIEVALFTAKTIEQYRDAMVNALEDVERLSNIVRALLMLSQAESGQLVLKKTNLDLAESVRDLVYEFQIPAEANGVELTARSPEHCVIQADRIQIDRLLSNLVSNAVKYTPAGGKVQVSLTAESEEVRLVVSDNGVGIAPDHLPHIFDRFYRVPSADPEKGLGLGLSFVVWIVRAHGGTIDVQSELGKGTTFTVTMPVEVRPPSEPEIPALTASEKLN